MNLRIRVVTCSLAVAGFLPIATAHAGEIFSSGTGYAFGNNPFSVSDVFVAEDFAFGSTQTIRSLSFNAYVTGTTLPITGVNVKFYEDSSGTPGTEVFSGVFGVAGSAITGTDDTYDLKDFYVNVGSVTLAAGSYWMGLQVDPAQWDMHWTVPSGGAFGSTALLGDELGTYYEYYGMHHSFKLYDTAFGVTPVPEPETYAMMLAGLGLLGLAARRRRAHKAAA